MRVDHKQFGDFRVKFTALMPIKLAVMSKDPANRSKSAPMVMGHHIPRVKPTGWGIFWTLVYLVFPVILLGNLIDFMFQYFVGWCIGVWCVFQS